MLQLIFILTLDRLRNLIKMQSITINNLPKISTNEIYAGVHWTKRKKHKQDFLLLTNGMKRLKPVEGIVDLEFVFTFRRNALDSSNNSYCAKILEDCLVHHKILKDDTIKFVRKISMESRKGEIDECQITILETLAN